MPRAESAFAGTAGLRAPGRRPLSRTPQSLLAPRPHLALWHTVTLLLTTYMAVQGPPRAQAFHL